MVQAVLVFVFLNVITNSYSAKVLVVIPTPSFSHQLVFRPLTLELSRRGHAVTVITPNPAYPKDEAPENLTEVDIYDLSHKTWTTEVNSSIDDKGDLLAIVKSIVTSVAKIFKAVILNKDIQEVLKQDFDLLLIEECVRPALIFSHIYKVPVIQITSYGLAIGSDVKIGAPNHPILYPLKYRQQIYNLTYWSKIRGIYQHVNYERLYKSYEYKEDEMLKEIFGPDIPTLSKLRDNVDMLFLNMHPIWYDNQPMPNSVVSITGLHQTPEKELPMDLKSYMEFSKHGVIYISFGSNIKTSILSPEKMQMMMEVLSQLPYNVIWKWDTEMLNLPKNVKLFKWLPQTDILKHPKLKLFITHGGLQSTEESIQAGVPLVGIPIFSDQWYNTDKYVRHGIGVQLDLGTFTQDDFKNAIVNVIGDNSYRNNVVRLRSLVYDQPQSALERAIWWTEYVLRHGGAKHLRAPAANISWMEYYELKLVLIFAGVFITTTSILLFVLNYLLNFMVTEWSSVIEKYFVKYKIK